MPGMLPVPNEQAFRYAIMFGLAIDAKINKRSVFERKTTFIRTSQRVIKPRSWKPHRGSGHVEIQLEDGTKGKSESTTLIWRRMPANPLHEDYHGMSGIDLNRAGTPLIEVVTEPDMRNAEEAVAFARKLHAIVTSLGICDGEMSQGSMRFDVNVSVRPKGEEKLGTRTETKT